MTAEQQTDGGAPTAWIYDAIRTPRGRGRAEGALAQVSPIHLVGGLLNTLTERGLDASEVDDVVLGCVTQVGEQGTDIARMATLMAGWPDAVPGMTVSRFCTSGLDAVSQASARVMSGMDTLVVAGGVESMSRVPMFSDRGAWFADPAVARGTRFIHMGLSADLIATRDGRSREALDAWALRSHQRAAEAWSKGHFDQSVIPVVRDGAPLVERDERIRPDLTMEALAERPASFAKMGAEGGDMMLRAAYPDVREVAHGHTSGSAPGIVDGAALVLVGSHSAGEAHGLRPRARVLSFAQAAVEPVIMLTGPVAASQKALARAGLTVDDIALWEINESFAGPTLHAIDALGCDPERVNVDGGAIAMGHPLGATGAILVGTLIDALERRGGGRGVVTMCGGAGVAAALVLEV
ncbi:MAG: acetyl-CoA C-acetyltransferase [Myxococcota bacterium]